LKAETKAKKLFNSGEDGSIKRVSELVLANSFSSAFSKLVEKDRQNNEEKRGGNQIEAIECNLPQLQLVDCPQGTLSLTNV
jgi:hypothetical protein